MSRFGIIRLLSGAFALSLKVATLSANREIIFPADVPTAGQSLRANSTNVNQLEWYTPSAGGGGGDITFTATPTGVFDVSGSPGTSITLSLDSQAANLVLAGPSSGGSATPGFRSLVAADIPNLDADKITSGTIAIARLPVGTSSTTVAAGNDSRFHNQNTDTGTNAQSFQINNGGSGVRIKDNAGVLEARNSADSAYADFACKNLTVTGTTTVINSETITLDDNLIVLNNNYSGSSPSENGGFEVERGTQTNASWIWDESADQWKAGLAGSELAIARIYSTTFTSAGLSGNSLTVTHNLGRKPVLWRVYSNSDIDVTPGATATSTNVLTLDFESITISGTWTVVVMG